jgi:hypothetical protein
MEPPNEKAGGACAAAAGVFELDIFPYAFDWLVSTVFRAVARLKDEDSRFAAFLAQCPGFKTDLVGVCAAYWKAFTTAEEDLQAPRSVVNVRWRT